MKALKPQDYFIPKTIIEIKQKIPKKPLTHLSPECVEIGLKFSREV